MKASLCAIAAAVAFLGSAGLVMAQTRLSPVAPSQPPYHRADTPGRPAIPDSDVQYSPAMQRLFQAAQRLRESVQDMAQQPAGPQRNEAMQTAEHALLATQEAMVQLPESLRVTKEYSDTQAQLEETHRLLKDRTANPQQTQAATERFAEHLPQLQQKGAQQSTGAPDSPSASATGGGQSGPSR
jgi:hypothetical protein